MHFVEFMLTNRGYQTPEGTPLDNIEGMDNRTPGQFFIHSGWTGYPDADVPCFDSADHSKTLAVFEAGATVPDGGTEVDEADVCNLLMTEYGWRAGTVMGEDGMPVEPER